jgi:hypothetical protein
MSCDSSHTQDQLREALNRFRRAHPRVHSELRAKIADLNRASNEPADGWRRLFAAEDRFRSRSHFAIAATKTASQIPLFCRISVSSCRNYVDRSNSNRTKHMDKASQIFAGTAVEHTPLNGRLAVGTRPPAPAGFSAANIQSKPGFPTIIPDSQTPVVVEPMHIELCSSLSLTLNQTSRLYGRRRLNSGGEASQCRAVQAKQEQ